MQSRLLLAAGLAVAAIQGFAAAAASPSSPPRAQAGQIVNIDGSSCTQAFLLVDRASGRRFEATAGHCIPDVGAVVQADGERMWRPGRGPRALDRDGRAFGRAVYAYVAGNEDFGLIELDRQTQADAAVGTLGTARDYDRHTYERPESVTMYGQGLIIGQAAPQRSLVVSPSIDQSTTTLEAIGPAAPVDSGAPVMTNDGLAVGMVIGGNAAVAPPGNVVLVRLAPMVARAERALRLRLTLLQR